MTTKNCGIYNILCLSNQKIYIGSSKDIHHRYYHHLYELRKNKHTNIHLQRAFNKYGKDSFELIIIENCQPENLLILEQEYLNNTNKDKCFNINYRAERPPSWKHKHHTEETKEKISQSNMGKTISEKQKKLISKIHKGKVISQQQKEILSQLFSGEKNPAYIDGRTMKDYFCQCGKKISIGATQCKNCYKPVGLKGENNYMFGTKRTENQKKNQSLKMKGKFAGEKNPSAKLSNENIKEIIDLFENGQTKASISRKYNISKTRVGQIIKKKNYYLSLN